ncbi:hypothetical protein N0V90_011298 [Kalmusia sp. IMI 367209]|nr:hypothetical protein N0V90_011298 [Kalmusia sp. IMI 367209]
MFKRDVPAEGTSADRDDFYSVIRANSVQLKIRDPMFGETALLNDQFGSQDTNYLMEGLFGCLGVVVVSHRGVFISHSWEGETLKPSQDAYFQSDVLDVLKISAVESLLREKFPGVQPHIFNYKKQKNEQIRSGGAWGKVAVTYSPDHGGSSIWQVYLQGEKHEEVFDNIELQVWRANVNSGSAMGAANVLQQVKAGAKIDPCNGDLAHGVTDSEGISAGSEVLDVGVEAVFGDHQPQKFSIRDPKNKDRKLYENCVFKGTGNLQVSW